MPKKQKLICPVEGCEKVVDSQGWRVHWGLHHKNTILEYKDFQALKSQALPALQSATDGAKPGGPVSTEPPPDFETLTTQEEMFRGVGQHVGIKEQVARAVAYYIAETCDLSDPDRIWEGLRECAQLNPSERRMWWRAWVSRNNLSPSVEVVEKVVAQSQPTSQTTSPASQQKGGESRYLVDPDSGEMQRIGPEEEDYKEAETFRRARDLSRDIMQHNLQQMQGKGKQYAVIGAQVVPLKEGEGGLNYGEASGEAQKNWDRRMEQERLALDRERAQTPVSTDQTVVSSLITALVGRNNGGGDRELMDSRMREMETRFTGQLELERERSKSAQENVVNAINSLKVTLEGTKKDSSDPFDTFDRYLTIQQKMEARITGEPVDDASAWRRDRGLLIKTLREQFPDFIEAGKEIAEATKMQAQSQGQQRVMKACPKCGTVVRYPAAAQEVQCPTCHTSLVPEVPASLPPKQAAPQETTSSTEAADVEGDRAKVSEETTLA